MSDFDRRQFLKGVLGKLAQATGVVVLASTAAPLAAAAQVKPVGTDGAEDVGARADLLAASSNGPAEAAAAEALGFLNLGIGRPRWRNGGWGNGGWGNGAWHNGGWPNVGWHNGVWHNGGWPNVGWRNWWG